jgi:hypothetical protein
MGIASLHPSYGLTSTLKLFFRPLAPRKGMRDGAIFYNVFMVICPVQSLTQKQFASRHTQISTINSAVSSLMRGGSRVVTDAGWDAVDAGCVGREKLFAGRFRP